MTQNIDKDLWNIAVICHATQSTIEAAYQNSLDLADRDPAQGDDLRAFSKRFCALVHEFRDLDKAELCELIITQLRQWRGPSGAVYSWTADQACTAVDRWELWQRSM